MRKFVQSYEVWIFLCLIIVGQMIFMYAIANGHIAEHRYYMGRLYLLAGILVAVVFYSRRLEGLIGLVRSLFNLKFPPIWLLLAVLWAPAVALGVLLIKAMFVEEGLAVITFKWDDITRWPVLKGVLTASLVGEIVWVSYSVGQLAKRFSPFLASQIVGAFWSVWWVPIAIYGKGIVPDVSMFSLTVNMLAVAAICAFFYFQTHSAFCVLVLQTVFNSTILILPVIPTNGGLSTYTAFTLAYYGVALLMFLMFGPKPLFDRNRGAAFA